MSGLSQSYVALVTWWYICIYFCDNLLLKYVFLDNSTYKYIKLVHCFYILLVLINK